MSSALVLSVTVLHPQKSRFQYTVDSLFLSAMTVIFYAANVNQVYFSFRNSNGFVYDLIVVIIVFVPLIYVIILSIWWIFSKIHTLKVT